MTPDESCARIARANFGIFTRAEALSSGLTVRDLRYRVRTSKLDEVLPGIYRPMGVPRSWEQLLYAAQRWSGPVSAGAGRSAARLWGFEGFVRNGVEVVTVRKLAAPRPDVTVRRSPLPPADIRGRDGIQITAPERTLLDLAALCRPRALESAIDDALALRLTTPDRLVRYLEVNARRGRTGTRALRSALDEIVGAAPSVRQFERRLYRTLLDLGLPKPVKQYPIHVRDRTFYIDFAYPDVLVGIEALGFRNHGARDNWEYDQERHSLITSLGWQIIYVTWRRMRDRPQAVGRDIADTLSRRLKNKPFAL